MHHSGADDDDGGVRGDALPGALPRRAHHPQEVAQAQARLSAAIPSIHVTTGASPNFDHQASHHYTTRAPQQENNCVVLLRLNVVVRCLLYRNKYINKQINKK